MNSRSGGKNETCLCAGHGFESISRHSPHMARIPSRKPIYVAADPLEAQIVINLLAAERIPCDVFGAMLWAGRGELAADPYPRLMLRDERHRAQAMELLEEYGNYSKQGNAPPPWRCDCGEAVPGNFAACWSCGAVPD